GSISTIICACATSSTRSAASRRARLSSTGSPFGEICRGCRRCRRRSWSIAGRDGRGVAFGGHRAVARNPGARGRAPMVRRERHRVILLKGAALLQDEYRGHVGLRPLGDIDLLVRPSDVPSVTGWLRRRGYEPVSPSSPFFSRGVVSFDLHSEIVGSDWVGRKARALRLDPAALW